MIVSDLQFHSRFCITSPPLEEASESWVCVKGGRFIINKLIQPFVKTKQRKSSTYNTIK